MVDTFREEWQDVAEEYPGQIVVIPVDLTMNLAVVSKEQCSAIWIYAAFRQNM